MTTDTKEDGRGGVAASKSQEAAYARFRVLVASADIGTRRLVQKILRREGLTVVAESSGSNIRTLAAAEDFGLAVVDVTRPNQLGFDLVRDFRALPRFRQTPIIMLTGLDAESDILRGFELGISDYVVKPFNRAILVARVHRALRQAATSNRGS